MCDLGAMPPPFLAVPARTEATFVRIFGPLLNGMDSNTDILPTIKPNLDYYDTDYGVLTLQVSTSSS